MIICCVRIEINKQNRKTFLSSYSYEPHYYNHNVFSYELITSWVYILDKNPYISNIRTLILPTLF